MPERPFEFIAGCPALCLVDTLAQREGPGIELLRTPAWLARWLCAADLIKGDVQAVNEQSLRSARALREAVHRSGWAVIGKRSIARADLVVINRAAAKPPLRPQLRGQALIHVAQVLVEAALSTLAADALRVLGTSLRSRIRVCSGCQMMVLDTARPGQRRWCASASGCGNRAKVRALRARRKQSATGASA